MFSGEKLIVIVLGVLVNVVIVVLMDFSISLKIKFYWLGSMYDFEEDIFWK